MMIGLFLLTLVVSLAAHFYLKRVYARHSRPPVRSGYTGAAVAQAILDRAGIRDVTLFDHEELPGDHYDPRHKRLVLSSANYHGTAAAALGVTSFASQLVLWIPLLGGFTGLLPLQSSLLIMAVAWGILMAFNLVTLPVEFDASRRAKLVLRQMGFIQRGSEAAAVNQVLNAAAWTYVAAFVGSRLYFLWHLLPLLTGRNRE